MSSTDTSRRKQLGNELRHARNAANMTQTQIAEVLGCRQGKINKIESGLTAVKLGDVRAMLEAYAITGEEAETLIGLARQIGGQRGRWSGYRSVVPHWFRTFTDLEPTAIEVLSWHSERIGALLQSEHFMLKQFVEDGVPDITSMVRNRLDRKAIFDRDERPYYRFIISESALCRAPGGSAPTVMLDQIEYMLDLSKKDRLYIHVLPFDARLASVPTDFAIMRFGGVPKDFAYIEHVAGGQYFDDAKDFQLFVDVWDRLRGAALEQRETKAILQKYADSYRNQMMV